MKVPSSDSPHNRNWNKDLSTTSLFRRWPQEVQIGVWEKWNREGKEAIAGLVKVQAALWAVGLNHDRERVWNTHSELSHQGVRTARRANQGIPKGISPEILIGRTAEAEALSDTLATWSDEPAHWKRPWCWERLRAGGEGDDRGWDDWMASLTQWTWVWANSERWWRTGKLDVLQSSPWGCKELDTTEWTTTKGWGG